MKKAIVFGLTVLLTAIALASCTSIKHEHIFGDYVSNGQYHHKPFIECTWDRCLVDPVISKCTDENGDTICDVCNYQMNELSNGDVSDDCYSYGWIEGIQVSPELFGVLEETKETDVIYMYAFYDGNPSDDFVYRELTYLEWENDLNEQRMLSTKLVSLLKDGEYLKHGDALYREGINGEKWAKELYEATREYYGEELLSRYIVDGELLTNEINVQIASCTVAIENIQDILIELGAQYRIYLAEAELEKFKEIAPDAEIKHESIHFSMTKEEFSNLTLDSKEMYLFCLDSSYYQKY